LGGWLKKHKQGKVMKLESLATHQKIPL